MKRHIVILDGYTVNPGDLSWDAIEALGPLQIYDRTPDDRIVERAAQAEIVLTNKSRIDGASIAALPKLAYIGLLSTGLNVVDIAAAQAQSVRVTNVPNYSSEAVSQMVFALLLEMARNTGLHSRAVRAGEWARQRDFCFWDSPQVELGGLTLGIVGLGSIGRAVAQLGSAFGMHIIASGRPDAALNKQTKQQNNQQSTQHSPDIERRTLEGLLVEADVVSLHCPLTEETHNLIDARRLALMKPSAWLINTARGGLIDEDALANALKNGAIAAAGLDVLKQEPPAPDNPLLSAPNCIITPHIAWASPRARARLIHLAAANIRAWQQGTPLNVVV